MLCAHDKKFKQEEECLFLTQILNVPVPPLRDHHRVYIYTGKYKYFQLSNTYIDAFRVDK